jgi:hypothetical protein
MFSREVKKHQEKMRELLYKTDVVEGYMDDGIFIAVFKVKKFDLDAAKDTVKKRLEASNGIAYPLLIDARQVQSITKEARDYFASDEGVSMLLASALILDSVLGKFLGNFFLQINKPKTPLRLFIDEKEALKWLQQFKPVKH